MNVDQKYSHNLESRGLFYLVGMLEPWAPSNSLLIALRKLLQGGRSESGAIYKFATKGKQAVWTSKNRYQVKEFMYGRAFYVWKDASLWAHSSLFLSYAAQLSGANPVFLFTLRSCRWQLCIPQLLSSHHGEWKHPLDQFWGALIHIWRQKLLMAVTFLVYYDRDSHFTGGSVYSAMTN